MKGKVLVTGGSGFIGKHLINYLLENGYETINLSLEKVNKGEDVIFDLIKGDYSMIDNLDFDHVVHLAAIAHPEQAEENEELSFNLNAIVTLRLYNRLLNKNVKKIIFMSSMYASFQSNFYSLTKKVSEEISTHYIKKHNLPITCIRLGNCYGPGQETNFFIPEKILEGLNGKVIVRDGGGLLKELVYVKDAVRAITKALECPYQGLLNVGTGKTISNRDIGKIIAEKTKAELKLLKNSKISTVERDTKETKRILNWQAEYEFEKGIEETINYYKK